MLKEETVGMCACSDRREYGCHCAEAELKIARLEKKYAALERDLTVAEEIIVNLRIQVRIQEVRLRIKSTPEDLAAYLEELRVLERRVKE
jgi:hypothetical protein